MRSKPLLQDVERGVPERPRDLVTGGCLAGCGGEAVVYVDVVRSSQELLLPREGEHHAGGALGRVLAEGSTDGGQQTLN